MVLHRSNFEIPARLSFQPFVAEWQFVMAETVEWAREPKIPRMSPLPADENPEKNWLRVRIEGLEANDPVSLAKIESGIDPSYSVLMARTAMPQGVLLTHENHRNTPDVSGRKFQTLICQKPELKLGLWALESGDVAKNAWIMRDEFLKLDMDSGLVWEQGLRQFLNRWGFWSSEQGYVEAWDSQSYPRLAALYGLASKHRTDKPDFMIVMPHLLKEQQERYRKALLPSSARSWLRLHPLSLETADEFPFFRVRKSYCSDAIEATITIDHLAGIKHGICKRCRNVFEKETRHKKNYCSERCFNAAGVQRWREKQRQKAKKGAKRNAKG